jgi:hypothetical protein
MQESGEKMAKNSPLSRAGDMSFLQNHVFFSRESFREILDVFYSKRQALNDLLQNEIAWDADIHFAIYLTNFGRGGEVDECGVAPALGASCGRYQSIS